MKKLFFIFIFLFIGCGVKAPPVPLDYTPPARVTDLKSEVSGDEIRLTWTIPRTTEKTPPLIGFYLFRSKKKMTISECPTCPITYEKIADLPIRQSDRDAGVIRFTEIRDAEFRYLYKVLGYAADGSQSSASNVVRIENEVK